jgi:4-oxalocrotonate tautomerase
VPIILIHMLPGRDEETKKALLKNVTGAVASTLNVQEESVRILIHEIPYLHYGIAGLPADEYRRRRGRMGARQAKKNQSK